MDQKKLERSLYAEYGPIMTVEDVSQLARLDPDDVYEHYQNGLLKGFEPVQQGDVRFSSSSVAQWLVALADGQPDDDDEEDEDEDEEDDDEDESADDHRTIRIRAPRLR